MERFLNEQIAIDSHPAEADNNSGDVTNATSFGKFKDLQSLVKAYNSLEAEFTKRSQRLSRLEGECAALRSELETKSDSSTTAEAEHAGSGVEDFFKKYPYAAEIKEYLLSVADGEGSKDLESAYIGILFNEVKKQADLLKEARENSRQVDSETKDGIIREFLSGISSAKPTSVLPEGEMILTPPIRPKNLREAKLLAEKYFR